MDERMKRASASDEAGFSLVELLVSLLLLGLISALLASGLNLGQRAWRRSEEKAQVSRAMFDVEAALRRLFEDLQPLRVDLQGTREIEFRGSADELEGIVPLPSHIGLGGLYRLHLFRNRSARRLDLTFHAYERGGARTSETNDDEAGLTTLATEIDRIELRYFGKAKGDEAANWRSDWLSQEELPVLIAITIAGDETDIIWPELMIAPRVKPVDWR